MDLKALVRKPVFTVLLSLFLIGAISLAYLGDYLNGRGHRAVLEPDRITLVGVDGESLSIRGDYRLTLQDMGFFTSWLESCDFTLDENNGGGPETVVYRGEYDGSLPIAVTIEPDGTSGAVTVSLSYKGHGFKRIFRRRKRKVDIFANEMVKRYLEFRNTPLYAHAP